MWCSAQPGHWYIASLGVRRASQMRQGCGTSPIIEQGELEDTGEKERGRKSSPHFVAIFSPQLYNVKCHRDNVQSRLAFSPFKPNGRPKMNVSSSTVVQKSEAHRFEVRLLSFLLDLTIRSLNLLSFNVVICRMGHSHSS